MKHYILEAVHIDPDGFWHGKHHVSDLRGWQSEGHPIKKIISIKPIKNRWAYKMSFN